jgi:cytochrome c-type biogenesis protein CcsB
MKQYFTKAMQLLAPVFNTRAAGLYILCFAAAIGIGTFVENDYGTSSAQHVIYKSWWFTLLLILFCITIITNIFRFRMVQQKKWALLMFHAAMVIILIGAGVTRYFGYEGIMHIRENDTSNSMLSSDTYLTLQILQNGKKFKVEEPVLFSSLGNNHWQESFQLGNDLIELEVKEFIPNPVQSMYESPLGFPTIKVVIAGMNGREEYFVTKGSTTKIQNLLFNFGEEPILEAVNIREREGQLFIQHDRPLVQTVMATQITDTLYPQQDYYPLMLRSMYNNGMTGFVFGDFNPSALVSLESGGLKVKNESMTVLRMGVKVNGQEEEVLVYGKKGLPGQLAISNLGNLSLALSYGSREVELPFSVKLFDFIMERYPGTESPTSFASEVQLIDSRDNIKENHRIFMNHVLDHDGYRFFQSSYDQDELGTYLSVNHDFWGTWITYIGYILLTLGMIWSLLSKSSHFYKISQNIQKMRTKNTSLLLIIGLSISSFMMHAQKTIDPISSQLIISEDHAEIFSRVIVQDHNGRMKPMHTHTRELMRKVMRTESFNGLNAEQVILGMFISSEDWVDVPMIKLGHHETIHQVLGVPGDKAKYRDFFNENGDYKLQNEVRRANGLSSIDRGVLEKELIKIDERVNIMNMIFGGDFLKIVPLAGDPNNTWTGPRANRHGNSSAENEVAERFFSSYVTALRESMSSSDYGLPNQLIAELKEYQKNKGASVMPSNAQVSAEITLNKLNVFNRLSALYAILGLCFLFFLFYSVFKPESNLSKVYKILFYTMVAGFLFHVTGLGLRWYVSGRAPWSNGYESMIYIAFTTVLAGIIFGRKSFGALAATMVLSATVLMVAMLSYMDPEITPLVPVLRSYWLTIHVSLEAGSYGFLMLGAVIGIINLILMVFIKKSNEKRLHLIIKEMTLLSEMTLTGGLFMISIGTYLGGVWANESWGRYWGWDAKETWALVTILVYAFILHMRIIPKLYSLFAFNFASTFGLASVIMTYYGVNYYLSGLHSYAAGDPVPVPSWVYMTVVGISIITILAWFRKRKFASFA